MIFKLKSKMLYKDFLKLWLSERKVFIKESTYASYSHIIKKHIIPVIGEYKMKELNRRILQEFIIAKYENGRISTSGKLSPYTIKEIIMVLKSSIRYAMKENFIKDISLDLEIPKYDKRPKIELLSNEEQKKLIKYILETPNIKNIGILLTLYSGMRIGEICALQWKNIDFKNNIVCINKTLQRIKLEDDTENGAKTKVIIDIPKTYTSKREIPLNSEFMKLLKKYKTFDNDYVLTCKSNSNEPRTYRRYFKRLLKKIGIKDVKFHVLRHTFATNCIKLGIDYKTVSELLGHSSVNTTLDLYVHPGIESKKKCMDLVYNEFTKL